MYLKHSGISRCVHPSPTLGFEGIMTPPLPPADEGENICPYSPGERTFYRETAIFCLESPCSSSADISPTKIYLSRPQSEDDSFPDTSVSRKGLY